MPLTKPTRRMAISNGMCVSFCNQLKAHYLAIPHESHAGMSLRVIWLHQESKSHFGFPWVCPWDNRDKFYMDGKRIQCLSNALQHVPIYLQPFPSNWTRKFAILAHFLHILAASPGYAPGTIAVNVTWIEREFNACQTPRSMYPFIFNHFPVIEPENSKVRHFSTFWYVLASPGYSLGQSR